MSFSSFQAGTGTSAGGAVYPLRTLVRDVIERVLQLELSRWLSRADSPPERGERNEYGHEIGEFDGRDSTGEDLDSWLYSNDSPLLLQNIPDYVLDPAGSLRAISERIDGPGHARSFSVGEITGVSPSQRAMEFRLRVKAFAELDAERILAMPRRRGTPKGETRSHYVWLISPDRDISNRDFKELVAKIIQCRWPDARVVGYIHRDTDNTHLHLWLSAEQTTRRKIYAGKVRQPDGTFVDKFRDIDEKVALAFSQHFNDPAIYEEHIAKKQEWERWRERFEDAIIKGERPPAMPHRARHEFDYVGEKVMVARREQGEGHQEEKGRKKAAPMPRTKSLMGALELWGKTVYLQAHVAYRRELLASLNGWQGLITYPVDGVRKHLERQLSETESEYQSYQRAFSKTLENRARKNYPELKYALHNSKQIAEMREIARLTYDAELLRYVHSYASLDMPVSREELSRKIGERWRDQILARLDVHELAEQLQRVAHINSPSDASDSARDDTSSRRLHLSPDERIVKGWLHGYWTTQQMKGTLQCIENDSTRYHAGRYVKSREYLEAAQEILVDSRRGNERLISYQPLENGDVARLQHLLEIEGAVSNEEERSLLRELVAFADNQKLTPKRFESLIERSLAATEGIEKASTRTSDTPHDLFILSPHDERWMGKLAGMTQVKEAEALALTLRGTSMEKFAEVRADARERRDVLNLAVTMRDSWGKTSESLIASLTRTEQRDLEEHLQFISEQVQKRDLNLSAQQLEVAREFARCLTEKEQAKLSRALELAQLQLEKMQRREETEKIKEQLDIAAQFFVRKVYQQEGLESLRDANRLDERVDSLTERYLQVIENQGKTSEQLGFSEKSLQAKARVTLAVSIDRFEKEEKEINSLSRLEAQKILAEQLSAVETHHRERFLARCYFMKWNYSTIDERHPGRISLADAKLDYAEQASLGKRADLPLMIIRKDAEGKLTDTINEIYGRLRSAEEQSRSEALSLAAQYDERLRTHREKGLSVREPKFTPEEFERLEECTAITRNAELNALISRSEETEFGPIYAARRSEGRALAAGIIQHNEFALASQYDKPIDLSKHHYLSPQLHAELSETLQRHEAARASEKSSAMSYCHSLESRAEELKRKCATPPGETLRPLLTLREANIIFPSLQEMTTHARFRWEQKLRRAQVMDEAINKKSHSDPNYHHAHPVLFEWAAKTQSPVARTLSKGYEMSLGETKVISYREAREIVKSHSREVQRDTTTPYRSRGR
ncbi:MAG: hypothetical protein WBP93_11175 [Pyrinomonadaceae bacterium]